MPLVVRCITKNVLVDRLNAASTMEVRLPQILAQIQGHDVILLQEVGIADVVPRLASMLPEYDFCAHEVTKRRTNFFGNMVLWRRDAFRRRQTTTTATTKTAQTEQRNSTTVFVALEQLDGAPSFVVASTHLKARRDEESARTRGLQLQANLKVLSAMASTTTPTKTKMAVLLAGDFNDELAAGGALAQQLDAAGLTAADTKATCHIFHRHLVLRAGDNADDNDSGCHEYLAIDKVVACSKSRVTIGAISANRPIPDADEPSDHFAVPFTLELLCGAAADVE